MFNMNIIQIYFTLEAVSGCFNLVLILVASCEQLGYKVFPSPCVIKILICLESFVHSGGSPYQFCSVYDLWSCVCHKRLSMLVLH